MGIQISPLREIIIEQFRLDPTQQEADAWGTNRLLHVPLVRLSLKIYIPGEH